MRNIALTLAVPILAGPILAGCIVVKPSSTQDLGSNQSPGLNQFLGPGQVGGALIGAAAGALLGAQIGAGTGNVAAIGAGATLGAIIGRTLGDAFDKANADRASTDQQNTERTNPAPYSEHGAPPDDYDYTPQPYPTPRNLVY